MYTVVSGYEGVIPRQQRLSIRTGERNRPGIVGHRVAVLILRCHGHAERCARCTAGRSRYQEFRRSTAGKRHVYRRRPGMATAIGCRHRLAARRLQSHAVAEGVYAVVPGHEGVAAR